MLNPTAGRIESYMDLLSARQRLVVSNIANAATPGYKTRDFDFQAEFRNAVEEQHAPGPVTLREPAGLKSKNDGNNVSMDRELRLLSETAMRFNVASNFWKLQMRQVQKAIEEGKNG